MNPIPYDQIETKLIEIGGSKVLLDSDVAAVYGVETKRVNEAVKNNPEKFSAGYIFELDDEEWNRLKSKISTSSHGGRRKRFKVFDLKFKHTIKKKKNG